MLQRKRPLFLYSHPYILAPIPEESTVTSEQLRCTSHYCSLGSERVSELEALNQEGSQNCPPTWPLAPTLLNPMTRTETSHVRMLLQVWRLHG